MGNTRRKGLDYLESKRGRPLPRCVAVSKLYASEESWTRKETWWFDLPIERIERLPQEDYHLLGECGEGKYVWLRVPNKDLHANMDRLDTKYQQRIRLHLAAYKEGWLIDERSHGGVSFSKYEVKEES
jgi:hypothetical protein